MAEKPLWKRVGIHAIRTKTEPQSNHSELYEKVESQTSTFPVKAVDTSNDLEQISSKTSKAQDARRTAVTKKNEDDVYFCQFMDDFKRFSQQQKSCISERPEEGQAESLNHIGPLGVDDTIASSFNINPRPMKQEKLLELIHPQFQTLKEELNKIRRLVSQQQKQFMSCIVELQMVGTVLLSKPSTEVQVSANCHSTHHTQDSVANGLSKSHLSEMTVCPQNKYRQRQLDKYNVMQLQYEQLKSLYESAKATNLVLQTCLKKEKNRVAVEQQLLQNKKNSEIDSMNRKFLTQLEQLKRTYEKIIEGNESTIRSLKKQLDTKIELLAIAERRQRDAIEMARHCSDNIYALKYKQMYEEVETERNKSRGLMVKLEQEVEQMRLNMQEERKYSQRLFEDVHKKNRQLEEIKVTHQMHMQDAKRALIKEYQVKTDELKLECKFLRQSLEDKEDSLETLTLELQEARNMIKTMQVLKTSEANPRKDAILNSSQEEYFPKLKHTESNISYTTTKNRGPQLNNFTKNQDLPEDHFCVSNRPFISDRQTKKNFGSSQYIGLSSLESSKSPKDYYFNLKMDMASTPPNKLCAANNKQKIHQKTQPSSLSARADYLSKMIRNEIQSSIRRPY